MSYKTRKAAGAVLTATLLLAVALSGCTTAAAGTSKAAQPKAEKNAGSDWASDAQLTVVMGFEGKGDFEGFGYFDIEDEESQGYFERSFRDERVGDGKTEVWAYVFTAASKPEEIFIVFYDGDGKRIGDTTENVGTDDFDDLAAIGNYDVNSDDAARIAKENNEDIRQSVEEPNSGLMLALGRSEEYQTTAWIVVGVGGSNQSADAGWIVIDAMTGDVIFSSTDFEGFGGFGG